MLTKLLLHKPSFVEEKKTEWRSSSFLKQSFCSNWHLVAIFVMMIGLFSWEGGVLCKVCNQYYWRIFSETGHVAHHDGDDDDDTPASYLSHHHHQRWKSYSFNQASIDAGMRELPNALEEINIISWTLHTKQMVQSTLLERALSVGGQI